MKKIPLIILMLALAGVARADTQDYIKANVILIKSRVAYFDVGQADGVAPGQRFEISMGKEILATGKIGWTDKDICRSEPLDSIAANRLINHRALVAKIRLYVISAGRGGYLNVAYFSGLNLEPSTIATPDDRMVARLIHRGLVLRDNDGQIVPDLCGDYEIRNLTYTFYLDPSNKFQSGKPVRAGDIVYSFEQLARAKRLSESSWFVTEIAGADEYRHGTKNEIAGIHIINDTTVAVTLKENFPSFQDYLAGPGGYIIPKPGPDIFGGEMTGAGVYRIKWHDDSGFALMPSGYTSGDSAFCDSIRFIRYTTPDEAGLAFELGKLDVIGLLGEPAPKFISKGKYPIRNYETPSYVYLGINNGLNMPESYSMGKAMSFLLNRDAIIRVILGGGGTLPIFHSPDGTADVNLAMPVNSDSADYYLRGLEDSLKNLNLYIDTDYPILAKVARYMEGQLQTKGIKITEKKIDFRTLDENEAHSELDLYLTCVMPVSANADCMLYPLFSVKLSGQTNYLYSVDEALQTFLDGLNIESDPLRRSGLAVGLMQSVAAQPPVVFLYQPAMTMIARGTVSGITAGPDGSLDLREAVRNGR